MQIVSITIAKLEELRMCCIVKKSPLCAGHTGVGGEGAVIKKTSQNYFAAQDIRQIIL